MFRFAIIRLYGTPFQKPVRRPLLDPFRPANRDCLRAQVRRASRAAAWTALAAVALFAAAPLANRSVLLNTRARLGAVDAQYWLGRTMFNQAANDEQVERGVALLREAARQGHVAAQASLGLIFAEGIGGVPRNASEALMWFHTAAAQQELATEARHDAPTSGFRGLFCSRGTLDTWGAGVSARNLEMAAVASTECIPEVTTLAGARYRQVRILRLDAEGVFVEFVSERGTRGLAQIKAQALPGQLGQLCGYSGETGVVPFEVWRQLMSPGKIYAQASVGR